MAGGLLVEEPVLGISGHVDEGCSGSAVYREAASTGVEFLSALPVLVLETIWSHLSYSSRRNLRASCRSLRLQLDADVVRSLEVTSPGTPGCAVLPLLPPQSSQPTCRYDRSNTAAVTAIFSDNAALPADSGVGAQASQLSAPSLPSDDARLRHMPSHRSPPAPTSTSDPSPSASFGSAAAHAGGRFQSLGSLVLTPAAAAAASCGSTAGGASRCLQRASLPPSLQSFFNPSPASLLAPFAASRSLSLLVLLDFVPGPSERDIAAIAAAFPLLSLLHILVSPGCTARTAAPSLGLLRSCSRLRSLAVDLGRGSVMGSGARASLGALTQLTQLVLGLADTGGNDLEAVSCGTGGLAELYGLRQSCRHHQPHLHPHQQQSQQQHHPHLHGHGMPSSGNGTVGSCSSSSCAGPSSGLAVVAAMVGGIEASLYCLARANLRSLELRVISFGCYERRLLQAVAAGSAEAQEACRAATEAPPPFRGGDGGGSSSSVSGRPTEPPVNGTAATATVNSAGAGLRHLCIRLIPSPHHAAASSASFAAAGGSGGLGGAFGGGGLGGDLSTPSASLSCGPLALGNALPGAVGWAQPSETEAMHVALGALPSLVAVHVPELLLTASHQLTCLSGLTGLCELRLGGVVAAGVPAPVAVPDGVVAPGGPASGPSAPRSLRRGGVVLLAVRHLTIEAESLLSYGSASSVPWWTVVCPSLRRLSLTLQYGSGGGGPGGGMAMRYDSDATRAAAEQLAAALARVPDVRLVVCGGSRAGSPAVPAGPCIPHHAAGCGSDVQAAALRRDLAVLLRCVPGVRRMEIYLDEPAELTKCLPADLLVRGMGEVAGGQCGGAVSGAEVAAAGAVPGDTDSRAGSQLCLDAFLSDPSGLGYDGLSQWQCEAAPPQRMSLLKFVCTAVGEDAVSGSSAAAAACATKLCDTVVSVLQSATLPLGCLCLTVPGLLAASGGAAGAGGHGASYGEVLTGLAAAAATRGTRLCLCSVGADQRAQLLHCLSRQGVEVVEGSCLE